MIAGIKTKTAGIIVLAVGIVLLILSLGIDLIRAGNGVVGPIQTAGIVVGIIIVAAGLVLALRKPPA